MFSTVKIRAMKRIVNARKVHLYAIMDNVYILIKNAMVCQIVEMEVTKLIVKNVLNSNVKRMINAYQVKLFKIKYINIKLFIIQNYLKESWVCDSNPDCGYLDYSDEENCKCKLNYKP